MEKYFGIDIGGTSAKMGILDENGTFLAEGSVPVAFDHYRTPILQTVLKASGEFLKKQCIDPAQIRAIGISATGQIDVQAGTVTGACGSIDNWLGARIKDEFEAKYGRPCYVLNDANAAALGEQWIGGARGKKHVLVFTIGTGVGGGIIIDGNLLLGAHGIAGELGHIIVKAGGELCTCGNRGCLEHYASTTALIRMIREAQEKGRISPFAEEELNGAGIFARADAGDAAVLAIIDEWSDYLAAAIIGMVHTLNPEIVLIGGGVSAQKEHFIDPLREKVVSKIMPSYAEDFVLDTCRLGNRAGMAGAVRYAIRQQES